MLSDHLPADHAEMPHPKETKRGRPQRHLAAVRNLQLALTITACAATPAGLAASKTPARPPNVIYILADDLGYGDLGCYGQTKFETPNIDRLASEGMRFTSFYAGSTVCAPSRSALLTGQHTGHTPIRGNAEVIPEGQFPLPAAAVTLPELLRQANYASAAIGKWGLGFIATEGDPLAQGFDRFFGYNCQRMAHRYYPPYLWENQRQVFLPGNDMRQTTTYAPDVLHAKAMDFIRTASRDRPFFLFIATPLPHAELLAPDDDIMSRFKGRFLETPFAGSNGNRGGSSEYGPDAALAGYAPQPAPRATFAAMVTRLDRQVGEMVDLIDALGMTNETLIIFTSDNGPHAEGGHDETFFASNGPFRGRKRDMYEGGIRVPMIARWRGRIPGDTIANRSHAAWDILPTLAELCRVDPPTGLDGISLVPTLLDQPGQREHEYLYWEFSQGTPRQALRSGDWKAIRTFPTGGRPETLELYNLAVDPSEQSNLATTEPSILKRLCGLMDAAHRPSPRFPLPIDKQ